MCQSLRPLIRYIILFKLPYLNGGQFKFPGSFFRETYNLSVGLKLKPLRTSVLRQKSSFFRKIY